MKRRTKWITVLAMIMLVALAIPVYAATGTSDSSASGTSNSSGSTDTYGTSTSSSQSAGYSESTAINEESATNLQPGTVTVTGKGELKISPDIATLSIGVSTLAPSADEAQAQNAAKFQAVVRVLNEQFKITDADVQTSSFTVYPEYESTLQDGAAQTITGYTATHAIVFTTRDLGSLGQILDATSQAGANQMNSVVFDIENTDQYEAQLIEYAMANADKKAAVMARASQRSLKGVISVAETQIETGNWGSNHSYSSSDSAGRSTVIQTGQITLATEVTVQYGMQ